MNRQPEPPYFAPIHEGLENQNEMTEAAFGRHVHWGYWADPPQCNGSPSKFGDAAEALCRVFCDTAGVQDGMHILDVGCGFGGTVASLNERFSNLRMVGVNIDAQQLARANELVQPCHGNAIDFQLANANCMPFHNCSFDMVMAVESIFHFDRQKFFAEARRLLIETGTLAISDFLISENALRFVNGLDLFGQQEIRESYGEVDLSFSLNRYDELAKSNGLKLREVVDITKNTMPTYDFILSNSAQLPTSGHGSSCIKATKMLQKACRQELMSYQILTFELA